MLLEGLANLARCLILDMKAKEAQNLGLYVS